MGFILLILVLLGLFIYELKNESPVALRRLDTLHIPDTQLPAEKDHLSTLVEIETENKRKQMDEYIKPTYISGGGLPVSNASRQVSASSNATEGKGKMKPEVQPLLRSRVEQFKPIRNPFQPVPKNSDSNERPASNLFGSFHASDKVLSEKRSNVSGEKDYYKVQVYGDQQVQNNTALAVRNTETVYYKNLVIPPNSIFYGRASFNGNRVIVQINRVKMPAGEFPIRFVIQDNDHIEGIYYKSPVDEVVDDAQDGVNTSVNPSKSINLVNSITQNGLSRTKELLQKTRTLNLEEGYLLYLVPPSPL